jgi:tetratricopeptide (TPR) repeat protein
VSPDGEVSLSIVSRKTTTLMKLASRAERDQWLQAIAATAAAPVSPPTGLGSRGSSSNILTSKVSPVAVTRKERSRSTSDPEITIGPMGPAQPRTLEASSLMSSPRSTGFAEFDIVMTFSKRFGELSDALQQDKLLVELAERLLEKDSLLQATQFAREAVSRQLASEEGAPNKEVLDGAARVMQRAEALAATGAADTKGQGWEAFDKEVMPLCRFLTEGRDVLSEAISEKDTDMNERATKFAADVFSRVLAPLAAATAARLPKAPTKYAVACFELNPLPEERLPYDGVNLGIVMQDYSEANRAYFSRMFRLLTLKVAQLGESAPVLLSPNWKTGFPGLRVSTDEEFLGLDLVGGIEQFVRMFEVEFEERHTLQTMMLLNPHFVAGDRALLKKYSKDLQALMDSHFLIPLSFNGTATYHEFAVPKLPAKKKLELFEPSQQIRRIKAGKFLGWLGNRWCGDLFLIKDNPYPKMANLKEEFWIPLVGCTAALRLLHGVSPELGEDAAFEALQSVHQVLGKRSVRHLKTALDKVRKYRLLAQLKNKSTNEYLYHRGVSSKPVGAWEISGKYLEKVMQIYQTVLPVMIGADDYFNSRTLTKNTFNLENLKLETPWVRLIGLQRMGLDEEALQDCIVLSEGQAFSMHRVVAAAENLSNARAAMGDFNGAIVDLGMLKEVCIDQKTRKAVSSVNGKLSVVLDLAGQTETAEKLRSEALEFMTATRTAKRDRLCLSINQGCHFMLNGKVPEAIEIFQAALKQAQSSRNRRLHKRSIQLSVPALLHNLGTCLVLNGQVREAVKIFEQELVLVSERFGSDSLDAAFCSLNLAAALMAAGNVKAAKAACYDGASVFSRVFGRSDEHVATIQEFATDLASK